MTKKTTRKRTKKSRQKNLNKKSFPKNIFIAILIVASILVLSYLFTSNESLFQEKSSRNIEKKDDILKQDYKKYSNEEVLKEVLDGLSQAVEDKTPIPTDLKQDPKESKEEEINQEIIKKVDSIKEEKKVKEQISKKDTKLEKPSKKTTEIEDEIIEDKKPKPSKKDLITKKDSYKHDTNKKPKLVIVIDDVVTKNQKETILSVGYPITMSFLPPTPDHKDSAKIALNLPFYIVHLPLEASKAFKNAEPNTLTVTDSYEKIEARIKEIRRFYPDAKYLNNHTGSVFTSNYKAMDNLFKALIKHNFIFVDSKTSPNSVAKELCVKYGMPYIVRDTFLDNKKDYKYIQNQLLDAVKVAKKVGFAIAIGHPYDITLKVLKESKHLLKDVELVYLNKLPYL